MKSPKIVAKITCTYFGDKSQKFAPTEKNSYTVSDVVFEFGLHVLEDCIIILFKRNLISEYYDYENR
mgnify:CR=1 FL=1